jgi:cathepsin L
LLFKFLFSIFIYNFKRFSIWRSNLDYVKKHNSEADAGHHTFWLKMNKFGDLTSQEFGRLYNGYNESLRTTPKSRNVFIYNPSLQVPDSVDWRTQGYVTPVKDQGQCGSCWAFSTTGSLEGQHFRASGKLVSLSEQNLVDCSRKYGNMGCNGGLMDQAFSYIKDNKGIDTEVSYPYTAMDGSCKFNPANVGATDSGFVDVKSKDENALQQAVGTVGPVSVAIDASHASFQLYSHGIYYEPVCSSTRLDHGVLAVGYGSDSGKDYWIVKNSWSTGWGDQGYIKMSRNRKNNCGIATSASYPTV